MLDKWKKNRRIKKLTKQKEKIEQLSPYRGTILVAELNELIRKTLCEEVRELYNEALSDEALEKKRLLESHIVNSMYDVLVDRIKICARRGDMSLYVDNVLEVSSNCNYNCNIHRSIMANRLKKDGFHVSDADETYIKVHWVKLK